MNIVVSNNTSQSAPTRADAVQAASVSPSVADAGDAATTPSSGFGAILSKNIADGATGDGKLGKPVPGADPSDAAHEPKSASATDPALLPPSIGLPAIPIDAASIGGVAKDDATKDDHPTAADAATTDAVTPGSDLAAQLALVSQWNGLKPRADAASAGDATKTGALDTQGKLDTIRGTAARVTQDAVPTGTVEANAATAATPDAATVLAAAPSAGLDRASSNAPRSIATDRATRSAAAAATAVAAATNHGASTAVATDQPIDAKILDLARAMAADTRSVTQVADATSLIAGIAGHASAGDPSTVSSFLAQVASQLGSQLGLQAPSPVVAATAASTDIAAPLDTLREPVGTPAWSHEVGQAALRMAANDMQNVSLRLNPEHLGPLDVQMRVDNGMAHLQFSAAHVETRQALESSRTTLDQMFGNQGIKLGDWSVGQQSSHTSFAHDFGSANAQGGRRDGHGATDAGGSVDTIATATIRTTRPLGLVDTFA